ncbi:MAG: hypothetical protein IMF19_09260, partial [Proteobacteria bacterium]|nr:hypothetical protein [Pseudomonadota bacterium]
MEEILSKDAFSLLQDLAVLNTGLESNLDRTALEEAYSAGNFATFFSELLDTGMLKKREGEEGIYQFLYHHIQEALQDDIKERDEKAINYYNKKSEKFGKNPDDFVEILFHISKINPDKRVRDAFIALCGNLSPVHYGFKRLVDVGLILKSRSEYGEEEKAPLIGSLGILYSDLRRFEAAETAYNDSLQVYKDLAD